MKSSRYFDFNKDNNKDDPKFKVGDHLRTSKYKKIFAKGYWSKEVFVIRKIKYTVLWIYVISDLTGEEIVGMFYEKELQKINEKGFRVEKVIKTKGDKLYLKWKSYEGCFKSWIDKKGSINEWIIF